MKKMTLGLLAMFLPGVAHMLCAQSGENKYLNVVAVNSTQSYAINSLQKITFENGRMQVYSSDEMGSFELNSLEKLFFSNSTGLNSLDGQKVISYFDSSSSTLYVTAESDSPILIYAADGTFRKSIPLKFSTDLTSLVPGVYFVRVANEVIKIVR